MSSRQRPRIRARNRVDGGKLLRRLTWRSSVLSIVVSLVGAVMVFTYLAVLSPTDACGDCRPSLGVQIAMVAGYFVVAAFLTDRIARLAYRGTRWLNEDREPTDRERRSTLRLPGRVALAIWLAWVIAAGVATAVLASQGSDGRELVRTATTIGFVGLVASTFVAFTLERVGRPVFTRALEGDDVALPSRWLGLHPRLLLGWIVSSAIPFTSLLLLPFTTADDDRGDVGITIFSLSVLGLVGGFAITSAVARGITAPLRGVRRALLEIGEGDLDTSVPVDASGELGQVQQGLNGMVRGLRERQRLETLFGRHVGAEVAQLAIAGGDRESEQREASALFVDVIGSTAMAARLAPSEVVQRLNDLFDAVVRVVEAEGGLVNKFEGDGALCVFGAPTALPDHATRALRAARALRTELARLAARHPGFDAGVGVGSGRVVAGRVGAAERYEYTVLGGPVNLAARLTDLAKGRPTRVVAASTSVAQADAGERRCWGPAGSVEVRGMDELVAVHEPLG